MAASPPKSPAPGTYLVDIPYGWEDDEKAREYNAIMAERFPDDPDYKEDPVLKAMRLEAEAEQDAEYDASLQTPQQHAQMMKNTMAAKRTLNFDRGLASTSVESYLTEDYMSAPSRSVMDNLGEIAYIKAYQNKAKQHKKLRKLLASPAKSSPVKSYKQVPSYAKQAAAAKKAVIQSLATPKKFGDINLDSSDDEDYLMPKKITKPAKKSFFAAIESPCTPKKSPSPFKAAAAPIKKSFFAAPVASSDSDSSLDIGIPKVSYSPKKVFLPKKTFFTAPSSSSPQKFKQLAQTTALNQRVQYLQKVLVGFKNYQPTNLLPEGVNLSLTKKRQEQSPQVAVDLEILLVKAMISKIELGQSTSSIDWDAWWVDVNKTLHDKYNSMAGKYITLANSL